MVVSMGEPVTGALCLLMHRPYSHFYFSELQMGVASACLNQNVVVEYLENYRQFSDRALRKISSISMLSGVILVPPVSDNLKVIAECERLNLAFVRVEPTVEKSRGYCVGIDNELAGYQAAKHLIGLGHTKIAFIENVAGIGSSDERKAGYIRALGEAGLVIRNDYIDGGPRPDNVGFHSAERLLALETPPTAMFAASDVIAIGAMSACAKHGRVVPTDISIIGFDNCAEASATWPPLTTMMQPIHHIGRAAAMLIDELTRSDGNFTPQRQTVLEHALIERASVAPPFRDRL